MRLWFALATVERVCLSVPGLLAMLLLVLPAVADAFAADPTPLPPALSGPPPNAAGAPGIDMSSAGPLAQLAMRLEREAMSDITMLPDTPQALARLWRSFDRDGSALGASINVGWLAVAACLALLAEKAVVWGSSFRVRRRMRRRPEGPTLAGLLALLLCDAVGVVVFASLFFYSRHWLMDLGVTASLLLFGFYALVRWRAACVVVRVLLRPGDSAARLIDLPDAESRRLARFLSGSLLAVTVLLAFGQYGLEDVDSGAPHIIGLIVAALICGVYALIAWRARAVAEALIGGEPSGFLNALRAALARFWLAIAFCAIGLLLLSFWFGLSLGLLSYYAATVSTLGIVLVLLVFERLTARGWRDTVAAPSMERLAARTVRRVLGAAVVLAALFALAGIWVQALELGDEPSAHVMLSIGIAVGTLLIASVSWELARMTIDRHLLGAHRGPHLPGGEDEASPGSRMQTVLPMLRAAFGIVIAVVAALIVLSHLGVNTAPLIAGAGVFGLAISFGSQSLVRDIISGLFYMWDDAFRVGEYIDTGRLKGTVEALGIRSVKLRHHNGPLHTIPYGQLGAVTNQSRDFATIKFNLRLEPGTDVELVRRTAKRIGLDMQEEPEMAAEVLVPLKLQGILEVTETALVLRFKFTSRPIKPSWVQREYLKRIYRDFAEKGVVFASGALTLKSAPSVLATGELRKLVPVDASGAEPVAVAAAARVA
jgi:small-conductance mechanosensitive channel